MFVINFVDGGTLTEEEAGTWRGVPKGRAIRSLSLMLPVSQNGSTNYFPCTPLPTNCDRYYCARISAIPLCVGGGTVMIGYALAAVKGNVFFQIEITHRGIGPLVVSEIGQCKIREGDWRGR